MMKSLRSFFYKTGRIHYSKFAVGRWMFIIFSCNCQVISGYIVAKRHITAYCETINIWIGFNIICDMDEHGSGKLPPIVLF